jgi:hypothetical protein
MDGFHSQALFAHAAKEFITYKLQEYCRSLF